jgi:hypothetical protein
VTTLRITTDRSTAPVGEVVTVTVTGVDAAGRETGDVTRQSALTIGPLGSCTGAGCTSTSTGLHTITATFSGLRSSTVVTFVSGPVDRLVVSPPATTATAGAPVRFTVDAFDRFGNAIGDVTGRSTFSIFPDGVCAGGECAATVAGPHTVTASEGGVTAMATLVVTPGPPTTLAVSPPMVQTAAAQVRTFTARGVDRFGNDTGDLTGATVFAIGPDGMCQANSCGASVAGTHVVSGRSGSLTGLATMEVVAGPTDHIVVSPSPASVAAGVPLTFTVTGVDAFGNVTGDLTSRSTVTVTPDGSCTGASCTFTVAGPHTAVIRADTFSAAVSVTVVPGARTGVVVMPASASRPAGVAQAYSVQGVDAFGNSTGDVTSEAGLTIGPDGTCTGPSCASTVAGPHVVTVAVGQQTATATLEVVPSSVQHLVVSPDGIKVTVDQPQAFTATGVDAFGNTLGDVTADAVFTIEPEGSCTANVCTLTKPGLHTVTATVGDVTGEASVIGDPANGPSS